MPELEQRRIGEIVSENYARAAAFQRFGLDFCCGGGQTVEAACRKRGIDPEAVLEALAEIDARSGVADDPVLRKEPAELAKHIVEVHHGYVRRTLPSLLQFSEKVARVHGETHPELIEIASIVREMDDEMTEHMEAEESGIFANLTADGPAAEADVSQLEDDHEHVGGLMARTRDLSDGFRPPEDACATYRATFALLEEFESDLHRHVHLENNVLFPALA